MVNWVVDTYILDSRSTIGDLLGSIRNSGANLFETKYIPLSEEQSYGPEEWIKEPTILYGTHGFVSKCKRGYTPGAYGISSNMNCNVYYSNIPNDWMLNSEFIFTTFHDLKQKPEKYFNMLNTSRLFIRPNSGFKTFAGFVITRSNALDELSSTMQLTSVMPETFVLVARYQPLNGEFRFIIGDGEVIDGSEYRWDNILDIRHDWPQECWDLADRMAKHSWQPDLVYTCDVAQTELYGPKIVEINSFACAGLYACNKDKVVNAINRIAEKEFSGG